MKPHVASDSFESVLHDVSRGQYPNEDTFRHHFLVALRNEIDRNCERESRKAALLSTLEFLLGRRRSDIRIGNVLFELEEPPKSQEVVSSSKREQVNDYMLRYRQEHGTPTTFGVVTNGWFVEVYENNLDRLIFKDTLTKGGVFLVQLFCTKIVKIDIADSSDFTSVFGLWS
jgi:hypothetical protein